MKKCLMCLCFVFVSLIPLACTASKEESNLLAPARTEDFQFGYINLEGEYIIEPRFNFASEFDDNGIAIVYIENNGIAYDLLWGYIDGNGSYILEPQYTYATPFYQGVAYVEQNERKFFINLKGEQVLEEAKFDKAGGFSDGIAPIQVDGKWGFINMQGEIVVEPQFEEIGCISEGKVTVKQSSDDLWGVIDTAGNWLVEPKFVSVSERGYHEGLLAARLYLGGNDWSLWGYFDESGNCVIDTQFSFANDFHEGLAAARRDLNTDELNPLGYIDKTGDWIIEPQFIRADWFSNGIGVVLEDTGMGYVTKEGEYKEWKDCEWSTIVGRFKKVK